MMIFVFFASILTLALVKPACVENCDPSYCQNSVCSKCIDGYLYNEDAGLCFSICDSGTFYRDGSCLSCGSGCRKCVDENICSVCSDGYDMGKAFKCIKCSSGYTYDLTSKECVACPAFGCDRCDMSGCITCPEFKHSYTTYEDCPGSYYCKKCANFCPSGYMETENYVCYACRPGCKTCNINSGNCLTCMPDYYYSNSDYTCKSCGCKNCEAEYVSCNETCVKKFYAISNGQRAYCSPCSDRNCDTCPQGICSICSSGYYLNSGGLCKPCSKLNCSKCENDVCTLCTTEFTFNFNTGNCRPINFTCPYGYYMHPTIERCTKCSQSSCIFCPNDVCIDLNPSDEDSAANTGLIAVIVIASFVLITLLAYFLIKKMKHKNSQNSDKTSINQKDQHEIKSQYQSEVEPVVKPENPKLKPFLKESKLEREDIDQKKYFENYQGQNINIIKVDIPDSILASQQPDQAQVIEHPEKENFKQQNLQDQSFQAEKLPISNQNSFHAPPLNLAFEYSETIKADKDEQKGINEELTIELPIKEESSNKQVYEDKEENEQFNPMTLQFEYEDE